MWREAGRTAQGRDDKLRDVLLVARLRREGKDNFDPALFLLEPRHPMLSGTRYGPVSIFTMSRCLGGNPWDTQAQSTLQMIPTSRSETIFYSEDLRTTGVSSDHRECCGYSFACLESTHGRRGLIQASVIWLTCNRFKGRDYHCNCAYLLDVCRQVKLGWRVKCRSIGERDSPRHQKNMPQVGDTPNVGGLATSTTSW